MRTNIYLSFALIAILVSVISMPAQATELRVRPHVDAPEPGIVLGNSTDCYVGAFQVRAVGLEDLVISRFSLYNRGVDETIESVTVAYYNIDGDLESRTGFLVNRTVTFSGAQVLASEFPNLNSVIYIYVDSADPIQADAGMHFRLDWIDLDFQAEGLISGLVYDESIATDFRRGVRMIWHESKPTVSLSAGSPAGAGIPGYDEVLRFNYSADSRNYVRNEELGFRLTSSDQDPNGFGWNSCANLGTETKWDVYDVNNSLLFGDWTFSTADGTDCSLAPDEPLVYARLSNIGGLIIQAGYTTLYSVNLDTTGASPAYDDEVSLGLVDMVWYDGADPRPFSGRFVSELPVEHDFPIQY